MSRPIQGTKQRYVACAFSLPDSELSALKALAALEQVSTSVICERIICAKLRRERRSIAVFRKIQEAHRKRKQVL